MSKQDEGEFDAVVFIDSHAETGEELTYAVSEISGEEVPVDILRPLIEGANADVPLAEWMRKTMFFDYAPGMKLDAGNVYRLHFRWSFEVDKFAVDVIHAEVIHD